VKKVYACIAILIVLIGFTVACELYVASTINQTIELLEKAEKSYSGKDHTTTLKHIQAAEQKWHNLIDKSNFLLADLTLVPEVTTSLARVRALVKYSSDSSHERFNEENIIAILLLKHFLKDNQSG